MRRFEITVTCDKGHKETYDLKQAQYNISADCSECELCGTHGKVTFRWKCNRCNEYYKIHLTEW